MSDHLTNCRCLDCRRYQYEPTQTVTPAPLSEYWMVEWRYPKLHERPASHWMMIERPPFVSEAEAQHYRQRPGYEYRIIHLIEVTK